MKILFFGFSHLGCIKEAYSRNPSPAAICEFHNLRNEAAARSKGTKNSREFDTSLVDTILGQTDKVGTVDIICLSIRGNEHVISSLFDLGLTIEHIKEKVESMVKTLSFPWLEHFSKLGRRVLLLPPPPPNSSEHIRNYPGLFEEKLRGRNISPDSTRIAAWEHQVGLLRARASELGLEFLDLPDDIFDGNGLLRANLAHDDPTHGNADFGAALLRRVFELAERLPQPHSGSRSAEKKAHPYKGLPDSAFWRESVAHPPLESLDPVCEVPFQIGKSDKVATAGSCFAQHISKRLRKGGFHFLITEQPTAVSPTDAEARGFYDFSARYGNIYTSRQLAQLFDRAYGYFTPIEDHWTLPDGRFCDPFRPRIEPNGFLSVADLRADRERHLAAVKNMFETLDIFVFTLGLTECWTSKLDGAAFPLAPGVAGGEFDTSRHSFVNLTIDDIRHDLDRFIGQLRLVNPRARLILTVSPVPLAATYSNEHVLVATTYSKAVLRVAAATTAQTHDNVYYFPSFELITGAYSRGRYFADDLRTVTDEGVSHVMRVFMDRLISKDERSNAPPQNDGVSLDAELSEIGELAEAVCDEVLLSTR